MSTKKRIAVTGGHGKVGRVLVKYLKEKGYDVFTIDNDGADYLKEPFMKADLTDFGQTLDALSSVGKDVYGLPQQKAFDVIIHLAGMGHQRVIPDGEELKTNVSVYYNVFEAARRLGIKDVIWAASEVAIGVPLDKTGVAYVPIDEAYPMRAYNVYALTKVLGEEMARQYCINDPEMRITCLRLSNVIDPEEYAEFKTWQDDPTQRIWNLWTYIDNRDAAQAFELAINYEARGKEDFFITNDETVMRTPTAELLEAYFPDVKQQKSFTGNETVISNKKAKEVLGFQPQFPWTKQV